MSEEAKRTVVKALQMKVAEAVLGQEAEKKRIKKGLLGASEERMVFEKILFLPYLDFTYQYPTEKGLLSKRVALGQGRSVVLALREVELGFFPDLASLSPQLVDMNFDSDSMVRGLESTVLVGERLMEIRKILSEYDNQLRELSNRQDSIPKGDSAREALKENLDHLRKTREMRWKMFADGLKLPSKIDIEKLELLQGSLFYLPHFIVRFARGGESRFLVWDWEGREDDPIADELLKNSKFRDLVQSYASN